ncbi:hypothetical protein FH063_000808 [Azospirillum argentinense]|uniref:Uncharacterized protein n=1 Tax=Azospirillum argentinense TaxID=2970906 RepID=A0A5B0L4J9_9PROT|nr:hypothetical protein FH063_000808 [Azospirillum argentinense]
MNENLRTIPSPLWGEGQGEGGARGGTSSTSAPPHRPFGPPSPQRGEGL